MSFLLSKIRKILNSIIISPFFTELPDDIFSSGNGIFIKLNMGNQEVMVSNNIQNTFFKIFFKTYILFYNIMFNF